VHEPVWLGTVSHLAVGPQELRLELLGPPLDVHVRVRTPLLQSCEVRRHGFLVAHGLVAVAVLICLDLEPAAGDEAFNRLGSALQGLVELAQPVHDHEGRAAHHVVVEVPVRPLGREALPLLVAIGDGAGGGVGVEGHDSLLGRCVKVESLVSDG